MHPEQIGSLRSCVACRVRASALKYFLYEKVLQRKKTLGAAPVPAWLHESRGGPRGGRAYVSMCFIDSAGGETEFLLQRPVLLGHVFLL